MEGKGDGKGPIKVTFLHEMPEEEEGPSNEGGKRGRKEGKKRDRKARGEEISRRFKQFVFMVIVAAVIAVFIIWAVKDMLFRLGALIVLVGAMLYKVRRMLLLPER